MTRQQVLTDIERTLGTVPMMFDKIPDSELELEWQLFQRVHLAEGKIPAKYRELIALAIAGVTKCQYCGYAHLQFARANGASEEEIEEAVHFAKSVAGWSTYANGLQLDFDQFKSEIDSMVEHARRVEKAA